MKVQIEIQTHDNYDHSGENDDNNYDKKTLPTYSTMIVNARTNMTFSELAKICHLECKQLLGNIRSDDLIFYKHDIIRMPKTMTLDTANILEQEKLLLGVAIEGYSIRCLICDSNNAIAHKLEITNLTKGSDLVRLVQEQLFTDISQYNSFFKKDLIKDNEYLSGLGIVNKSDIFFFHKGLVNA